MNASSCPKRKHTFQSSSFNTGTKLRKVQLKYRDICRIRHPSPQSPKCSTRLLVPTQPSTTYWG